MSPELADAITCWNCGGVFSMSAAEMCDGCVARMHSNYVSRTLKCPHCLLCACDQIDRWERDGKITRTPGHERFDWVHRDQIVDARGVQ